LATEIFPPVIQSIDLAKNNTSNGRVITKFPIAQNHWTASGSANTNLDFLLKQHNIDHVVIAGMKANTCIDTTSRYAIKICG
jgi:nicotinamidase-related amidase